MTDKQKARRIGMYVNADALAKINIDDKRGETANYRIVYLSLAAVTLAQDSAPGLKYGEWMAICDALNGYYAGDRDDLSSILRSAWHSVYDSAQECDEKWSVNCEQLAKDLNNLTLAEQFSVFEIARKFWTVEVKADSYQEILEKIGGNIKN